MSDDWEAYDHAATERARRLTKEITETTVRLNGDIYETVWKNGRLVRQTVTKRK